jgi:hypothetical protein
MEAQRWRAVSYLLRANQGAVYAEQVMLMMISPFGQLGL